MDNLVISIKKAAFKLWSFLWCMKASPFCAAPCSTGRARRLPWVCGQPVFQTRERFHRWSLFLLTNHDKTCHFGLDQQLAIASIWKVSAYYKTDRLLWWSYSSSHGMMKYPFHFLHKWVMSEQKEAPESLVAVTHSLAEPGNNNVIRNATLLHFVRKAEGYNTNTRQQLGWDSLGVWLLWDQCKESAARRSPPGWSMTYKHNIVVIQPPYGWKLK